MRSLPPDVPDGPRADILALVSHEPGVHLRGIERETTLPTPLSRMRRATDSTGSFASQATGFFVMKCSTCMGPGRVEHPAEVCVF